MNNPYILNTYNIWDIPPIVVTIFGSWQFSSTGNFEWNYVNFVNFPVNFQAHISFRFCQFSGSYLFPFSDNEFVIKNSVFCEWNGYKKKTHSKTSLFLYKLQIWIANTGCFSIWANSRADFNPL